MKIQLNGQEKQFDAPLTVDALLERLGLVGQRVAVEVNREIVPRSRHGELTLRDNDCVEVVRAIGGGSGMSRRAHDRRGRSRGPIPWGYDPEAGRGGHTAVVGIASAARFPAGPLGRRSGAPAPRSGDAAGEGRRPPTGGGKVSQDVSGGGEWQFQ